MFPSNGVQLNLPTGTITHQIKQQVKETRLLDNQIKYLCKKNEWNQSTCETIAWEPHRRAINRRAKKKVTMVKYLNVITPVGKVVSKYNKKYPTQ
jgi:hypothetical protein